MPKSFQTNISHFGNQTFEHFDCVEEVRSTHFGDLKWWHFETLTIWTLKLWNFGTLELWNFETLKLCNLKLWNSEILKLWNFVIPNTYNIKSRNSLIRQWSIMNSWRLMARGSTPPHPPCPHPPRRPRDTGRAPVSHGPSTINHS